MAEWTCRRCLTRNAPRTRKCGACAKPRPARRRPKHMAALEQPYQHYITINGGEFCGVCRRPPSVARKLDRDHDHKTGTPRGLCCVRCNRALASWMTVEWLEAAAAYLRRAQERAA